MKNSRLKEMPEHDAANHQLVLRVLQSANTPMTAYEILHAASAKWVPFPADSLPRLKAIDELRGRPSPGIDQRVLKLQQP